MVMPRRIIYDLVEGDTGPDLRVRFTGLTLSDYSSISMKIQYDDGSRVSRTVTADATDAELGTVTWQAGDLIRGQHKAEFELTRADDSTVFTIPRRFSILLNVRADLG